MLQVLDDTGTPVRGAPVEIQTMSTSMTNGPDGKVSVGSVWGEHWLMVRPERAGEKAVSDL